MFRIRKPLIPHNKHRFTITIIKGVQFASASTATGNKDQSTAEGFETVTRVSQSALQGAISCPG